MTKNHIALGLLALPCGVYFVLACCVHGGLPHPPSSDAQVAIATTSTQVGATALAIFFAAAAIILTRQEPRGTERAIGLVIMKAQSLFTLVTLIVGTFLGMIDSLLLLNAGTVPVNPPQWGLLPILILLPPLLVLSGILGAIWWFRSTSEILSTRAILNHFCHDIPEDWIEKANAAADRMWQEAFKKHSRREAGLSMSALDGYALAMPTDDPVAFALDAVSGWILGSNGRPIADTVDDCLEELFPKLMNANAHLAQDVLPAHLIQVLRAAIASDDPKIILTVLEWISRLHLAWERGGLTCVRANHYNWLMPILTPWIKQRGVDYASNQVLAYVFKQAATKTKEGRSAMIIAFPYFVRLMKEAMKSQESMAAEQIWILLDLHIREDGAKLSDHAIEEVLRVVRWADAHKVTVFGDEDRPGMGFFKDWAAICLAQAVEAAVRKSNSGDPKVNIDAEEAFACRLSGKVLSLYPAGEKPQWQGKPVDSCMEQLSLGQACCPVTLASDPSKTTTTPGNPDSGLEGGRPDPQVQSRLS